MSEKDWKIEDELPAGPELDVLAAELVMGWTYDGYCRSGPVYRDFMGWTHELRAVGGKYEECMWAPSIKITDAWMLVERLTYTTNPLIWFRFTSNYAGCTCSFIVNPTEDSKEYRIDFGGDTAPHVITMAAVRMARWNKQREQAR